MKRPHSAKARHTPPPRGTEAEQIVAAIGEGAVDAVVVQDRGRDRVLALTTYGTVSELSDTVRAIQQGEVDAFVVKEGDEFRVHTIAQFQQALRASESANRAALEQLNLALSASGAALWEWEENGREFRCSNQFCELYGLDVKVRASVTAWRRSVHPDDLESVLTGIRRAFKSAAPGEWWRDSFRIVHPKRGERWIEGTGRVAHSETGNRFIRGIHIDITDRKAMEQELAEHGRRLEEQVEERTSELRAAHARLRQAERLAAVGTLAAGLTHDMNNVLLPLSGRVEGLLMQPGLDASSRDDLQAVNALLDHLRQMSKNLSLFARDPDQEGIIGRTNLSQWSEQVRPFIEASVARNQPQLFQIKWKIPPGLDPVAVAPHRVTQAVLNLVHNAHDAILQSHRTAKGKAKSTSHSITIEAAPCRDPRGVMLTVADTGCGMDEETLQHCTDLFYTTKARPRAAGAAGSGMGMSIASAIAERVGGSMHIESAPGAGTTVSITLPAADPA